MTEDWPHPTPAEKEPAAQSWTPPVNQEFERYGEAHFISLAPHFMPRWLLHAEPRNVTAISMDYALVQLFRPAVFACLAFATWCLRKSWTVAVERRDTAGAADWRFVLRDEYRSYAAAVRRRGEIVENWRDEVLSDWRGGDYTPLPFID